jgi:RNA-directed DNA polymerase
VILYRSKIGFRLNTGLPDFRRSLVLVDQAAQDRFRRICQVCGILGEDRILRETSAGTPQGSILSPLLSNVALSVLDEHINRSPGGPRASDYQRSKRRAQNLPNYRLIRYADDWCLVIAGTREDAEALREEIAGVLSAMGLRLSPEKTLITHIDQGLDFLGWRIQRRRKRGTDRYYVYTYPAKKAVASISGKVRALCRQDVNLPLEVLLHRLNNAMRGWCNYFRPGVSSAAFAYLRAFVWRRVFGWLRRKHPRGTWKDLRREYCGRGWWPRDGKTALFNPAAVRTTRYRYRGSVIPSPWPRTAAAQG